MTDAPQPTIPPDRTPPPPKGGNPDDQAASGCHIWRYALSAAVILVMGLMVTTVLTFNSEALTVEPLPAVANSVAAAVEAVAAAIPPAAAKKPGEKPAARTALPEAPRRAMPSETGHKRLARLHPAPAAPYALHLGSFRSLEKARQSAARYREKGITAHWQLMRKDHLYHLCAGKFETPAEAARFKSDHGLGKAVIINAPLTIRVLPETTRTTDADICRFLARIGYDSLRERGLTNDTEIYTGLFSSLADATAVADRINNSGRFLAWVVHR